MTEEEKSCPECGRIWRIAYGGNHESGCAIGLWQKSEFFGQLAIKPKDIIKIVVT